MLQSNEYACDTEISQFIHAGDHPLNLWECTLFKAVTASDLPTRNKYEPPKINIVGGSLLEDNFEHVKGNNDTQLQKYSFTYGMAEMGYGEKLVKMMMFNVLA